jgi:signal transduction histidine kinase
VKPKKEDIQSFFMNEKENFISRWFERVLQILKDENGGAEIEMGRDEFEQLFNAYIDDMVQDRFFMSNSYLVRLIESKIKDGLLLSTLELINASFMTTAREMFRSYYPDAFDTRMEYLEKLSQMILNNEVMLAQHYESYLTDLNTKLTENTRILTRHHQSLLEFIDIATHQLQAPLWSILGFVSNLQRKYYETIDQKGRHYLNRINANVSEMHQLIEDVTQMLLLSQDNMIKKELYLPDLFSQAHRRVKDEVDEEFICELKGDYNASITGDPHHLKQLFYHILKNVSQYTESVKHGEAIINCSRENDSYIIDIEDKGIGIEPRHRDLVFKPIERLQEKDVPGSGMGLTFAQMIVESHGGSIKLIGTQIGKGICVRMEFPGTLVRNIEL